MSTVPTPTSSRRHVRLVFALAIAALLGVFAVYTAFAGSTTPLVGVAEAAAGKHAGETVLITGKVISFDGDAQSEGGMRIVLRDHEAGREVGVVYHGTVPDAFRVDRQIVVEGTMANGTFVAKDDTLVTKCPSKYTPASQSGTASS